MCFKDCIFKSYCQGVAIVTFSASLEWAFLLVFLTNYYNASSPPLSPFQGVTRCWLFYFSSDANIIESLLIGLHHKARILKACLQVFATILALWDKRNNDLDVWRFNRIRLLLSHKALQIKIFPCAYFTVYKGVVLFNPFHVIDLFLYPMKTLENQIFL